MSEQNLPRIILASASPRRRELLTALGLEFEVRPSDVDETLKRSEHAEDAALRLSRDKAVHCQASSGEVVIAADTLVVLDDKILGKPTDAAQAQEMLMSLRGREHNVVTGIAIKTHAGGRDVQIAQALHATKVAMRVYSRQEIDAYIA